MKKIETNDKYNLPPYLDKNRKLNCVLTPRKIEYIVLAAFGLTNKNIAEVLCITESTVKKTFEDIFYKLQASDRASMVNIAWVSGILSDDLEMRIFYKYCPTYYSRARSFLAYSLSWI